MSLGNPVKTLRSSSPRSSWPRPNATPPPTRRPKYSGRKKGVTWLNMIDDQGVGTVLSGTPRDSLYAIDLMNRRDDGARPTATTRSNRCNWPKASGDADPDEE